MAAVTVATPIPTSPAQSAKNAASASRKTGGVEMAKCPKCAHKIEAYAVDTNCSFRMCANLGCTWPFDCDNMAQCFEQDATVPSMRKRAKKRKALASKDEHRRAKRRQSVVSKTPSTLSSRTLSMSAIGADTVPRFYSHSVLPPALTAIDSTRSAAVDPLASTLPFLATPITANSASENDSINQLPDWLAGLCSSTNGDGSLVTNALSSSTIGLQQTADYSAVVDSTTNGNALFSQGKYQQDSPCSSALHSESNVETLSGARAANTCAHGPCDNSYSEPLSADWLESLLSLSSSQQPSMAAVPAGAANDSSLLTSVSRLPFVQHQPEQFSGNSSINAGNEPHSTEGASFVQQFSIDGATGRDSTSLASAAPNITCGGTLLDPVYSNVVEDIFSIFGTSSASPLPPASAPTASLTKAHSPSATLVDDAVIPRTSRHPSPATSNSESGADDIDAHTPMSPDDLALLIGGCHSGSDASGISGKLPVSSSATKTAANVNASSAGAGILDPFSALISPSSSAQLNMSDGSGKHNANGGTSSFGMFDRYYWPPSITSAPADSTRTTTDASLSKDAYSSGLSSSVVPPSSSSRSASCSDATPFDFSDLFGTANTASSDTGDDGTVSAKAESTNSNIPPVTGTPASAVDTASIIDNIFG
ncbi:hypothetical protein H4S06_005001 [Coemansia sp. BCRC 34490]|nr:hypothetical protein H4S06_005001 [Coemansia sp. BCRC 34490]